jgi:DNA-nicking Smr family endonuclease
LIARLKRGKVISTMAEDEIEGIPEGQPVDLPIDGVLDLHTFRPKDVKEVVLAYLEECQKRRLLKIRIIHGKGIGQLRQTVHTLLAKHPQVVSYTLAGEALGSWGATIVTLRPPA